LYISRFVLGFITKHKDCSQALEYTGISIIGDEGIPEGREPLREGRDLIPITLKEL